MIDGSLAERLLRMVGLPSVALHAYQKLDPRIVQAIVSHPLEDLCAFARGIAKRYLRT